MWSNLLYLLGLGVICGWLSGLAGSSKGEKHLRRFVIPAIHLLSIYLIYKNWGYASIALVLILPYSLGHGIPSDNDEGSTLGKFWANIFPNKDKWINIAVRATKGALKGIIPIIFGVLTGAWYIFLPAFLLSVAVNVIFGGDSIVKGEPIIKGLNSEEMLIAFGDYIVIQGSLYLYLIN